MQGKQERPRLKGDLWMTAADHKRSGGTPPFDPKLGMDVPFGDMLSDTELADHYRESLRGIRTILGLPPEQREMLNRFITDFFPSDLDYYRSRGMDVTEGERLIKSNPVQQENQ